MDEQINKEDIKLTDSSDSALPMTNDLANMGFFHRLFGVIFSPGKVMQSLAQKPRILFALFLTILTPIVKIYSVMPMYLQYMLNNRSAVEATYQKMNITMTSEQIDQIIIKSTKSTPFILAASDVAKWFLGALILWVIMKIFKGQSKYKQILSVTGYAAVVVALGTIVEIAVTRITGVYTEISFTSLASILPDMKGSFIYGAAKAIDVFNIWYYTVIAIGTAAVSKIGKKKAYLVIACIFAVIVVYTGATEVMSAGIVK